MNSGPWQWHIVLWLAPHREFATTVFANNVCNAICNAISEANMTPEELVHEIHISPPKAIN